MILTFRTTRRLLFALTMTLALSPSALGYEFEDGDRWLRTAVDGTGLGQGDPTTITWSIAPDNTTVPDGDFGSGASGLIQFFDTLYPGGSGSDLTQRPWFYLFEQSFGRWEALSGIDFVYEDDDDGVSFSSLNIRRGIVDRRGDIRIGATAIDGQDGQNTIAFAYSPDYGEMVIDTDNTDLFGNDFNSARAPRNVITHEIGHALGLEHLNSSDAAILMEPFLSVAYDGPQFDDILAIHRGYGDVNEKANNKQGNETAALATTLGLLADGVKTSVGTDADDTVVAPGEVEFVSIDDDSDIDFYSFTIDQRAVLDVTLTPMGPTYNSGPDGGPESPLVTSALSDLALALFDVDGVTPLMMVDLTAAGAGEQIDDWLLTDAGTYYVRITGADNAPQLYQLDIEAELVPPIPGDLNGDFEVDQDDLAIVLGQFGRSVTPGLPSAGDPTGDGAVGINDIDLVLAHWTSAVPAVVPEPVSAGLVGVLLVAVRRRRFG